MGMTIYLAEDEINLIFEAIDMLKSDYSQNGHPEEKKLDGILSKILITRKPTFQNGGIIKGGLLPDETPIMASTEEAWPV